MRRLAALLFIVALFPATAGAAKQPVPQPWRLTAEDGPTNPFRTFPCLTEDSWHQRTWQGYLHGSFTAAEDYCQPGIDYGDGYTQWDGGGQGLSVYAQLAGDATLSLSSSGGVYTPAFTQHAQLIDTQVLGRGRNATTWRYYEMSVCFGAQPDVANDFPYGPFTGEWTFTIVGDFSDARVTEASSMSCPSVF